MEQPQEPRISNSPGGLGDSRKTTAETEIHQGFWREEPREKAVWAGKTKVIAIRVKEKVT